MDDYSKADLFVSSAVVAFIKRTLRLSSFRLRICLQLSFSWSDNSFQFSILLVESSVLIKIGPNGSNRRVYPNLSVGIDSNFGSFGRTNMLKCSPIRSQLQRITTKIRVIVKESSSWHASWRCKLCELSSRQFEFFGIEL